MCPAQYSHEHTTPQDTALYVSAFFDELYRVGVQNAVISPGSRSTALAMVAYASPLECYVDVDERGAAFFALGLAKATGRPACIICTSGTALANYYPAVLEAEASRVPLIVLSGDRPQFLQEVGAPQTCDQLKIFSNHVRHFWQMPEPYATPERIRYVRQIAKEAYIASGGIGGQAAGASSPQGAPVHLNFPFDEPLKPDLSVPDLFTIGRRLDHALPVIESADTSNLDTMSAEVSNLDTMSADTSNLDTISTGVSGFGSMTALRLAEFLRKRNVIVVCGEGTLGQAAINKHAGHKHGVHANNVSTPAMSVSQAALEAASGDADATNNAEASRTDEAICAQQRKALYHFAEVFDAPLLADPLSQLRSESHPAIIDNYDNILRRENRAHHDSVARCDNMTHASVAQHKELDECPEFDVVVRFGRWPVSKALTQAISAQQPFQIVIDPSATRDFTSSTSMFIKAQPQNFVGSLLHAADLLDAEASSFSDRKTSSYLHQWAQRNTQERSRILEAYHSPHDQFEGSYVAELIARTPANSLLFSGNSMAVRALDTFYLKHDKPFTVLANRGLNGIDGTLSTAIGAAQAFDKTVCLVGDLTFLHDVNALMLQHEMVLRKTQGKPLPTIVIVVLNNTGGAIFDMLPQAEDNPYFERLFATPQDVNIKELTGGFRVPYLFTRDVKSFGELLSSALDEPGLHVIEIALPREGVRKRYAPYW